MTDYSSIAQTLTESLKLRVPPVAVCLSDKPPQGVPGPSKPAAAGCVFWEWGAKGALVTAAKDHGNCAVGMYTHHMPLATAAQQDDLHTCLKVFGDLGYVRPEDIPSIPVLKDEPQYSFTRRLPRHLLRRQQFFCSRIPVRASRLRKPCSRWSRVCRLPWGGRPAPSYRRVLIRESRR